MTNIGPWKDFIPFYIYCFYPLAFKCVPLWVAHFNTVTSAGDWYFDTFDAYYYQRKDTFEQMVVAL